MLLTQGVKEALPNAQKQTWGGCQIEETKKYGPNERTEQSLRTKQNGKLNKIEKTNPRDAESKTLVIRTLIELTKYGNNMKKTQEEMKVTLSEIKKNLQGTIRGGEEARIQINKLEHKEEISI